MQRHTGWEFVFSQSWALLWGIILFLGEDHAHRAGPSNLEAQFQASDMAAVDCLKRHISTYVLATYKHHLLLLSRVVIDFGKGSISECMCKTMQIIVSGETSSTESLFGN